MTDETRDTEQEALPFGGMPTAPDVQRIRDAWPNPKKGDTISYADVRKAIGAPLDEARFRTVTNAWRYYMLRDKSLVIQCNPGVGFVVLDDEKTVGCGWHHLLKAKRQARRAAVKTVTADRSKLTGDSATDYDHAIRTSSALNHVYTAGKSGKIGTPAEVKRITE